MNTVKHLNKTKIIARTALGIALVIVSQLLGKLIPPIAVIFGPFSVSQLLTGTLVNCILIVFTVNTGVLSGILIGVLSSVMATILGVGPIIPLITPVIAAGNALLVIIFRISGCNTKLGGIPAVVFSSAAKCVFLWLTVPVVLSLIPDIVPKQTAMLSIMFSWPQGVTAMLGGFLALTINRALSGALDKK
ncbi:MAG: hypothetical protein RRZ42_08185 [Oscillospiraceae bacterium]